MIGDRQKRLEALTAAPSQIDAFTQDNVPLGLSLSALKQRYACKLKGSDQVAEFAPLNFKPTIGAVFPAAGGFDLGYRVNGMGYESLMPTLATSMGPCNTVREKTPYGVYWRKRDQMVVAMQKFVDVKGAPAEIFTTAYQSLRQSCKGTVSPEVQGRWTVTRSEERFAAYCDQGSTRTLISTNPIFRKSLVVTYIDRVSWQEEIDHERAGVTNTKSDVDTLSGRL